MGQACSLLLLLLDTNYENALKTGLVNSQDDLTGTPALGTAGAHLGQCHPALPCEVLSGAGESV